MSQWNNSYAYNSQYQNSNTWNADVNGQYVNQAYYTRPDGSNQYVSFNEFLNQMQSGNGVAANTANYNNVQYEGYPNRQYSYQNLPSTSQTQSNNYNYGSAHMNEPNESNMNEPNESASIQNQLNAVPDVSSYTSDMILNSNLTPTATEFVPKATVSHSSSSNRKNLDTSATKNSVLEPQNNYQKRVGNSSSDKNWRERPQTSQPCEVKKSPAVNEYSQENGKSYGNRHRGTFNKNDESNSRNCEYNNRNHDAANWDNDSEPQNEESVSRNNQSSKQINEYSSQNNESNSRESHSQNGYDSNSRNRDSNNRYNESKSRTHESNSRNIGTSRNNEPYSRYENNSYNNSNNRNESTSRSQGSSKNQESNSHSYESGNRNDRKNQSKSNSKFKSKESDNRTFYNSSISKEQDVRVGRGERGEGNARGGRNWTGSQRLREADRNNVEDEQYAGNYVPQKEDRVEKEPTSRVGSTASPVRFRSKQHGDQVNKEMTQRERLTEQLDKGALECLVCCDRVKQMDPVWSCSNCYHVLHLRCIRKWAISSLVEGNWRCPACQNTNSSIPTDYRCMCGAVRSPEYRRGASGAHTCGGACRRPRCCPHPCTLPCHPGPCPPCQATLTKKCGCGAESRSVLCSSKLPQECGRTCGRKLECGVHSCAKDCHEGLCGSCAETVTQVCYCGAAVSRTVACSAETGTVTAWSCGGACARVLACGAHVCRAPCHAPPCPDCALLPTAVTACPCGKMQLDKDKRKSCTDPIPLCGNICAKPLPCGPAGDKHFCKQDCHEGPCPVCPDKTLMQCRCGHSSREIPCAELPEMTNNVLCQKKCNKKLSCGRHRCRTTCCDAGSHRCTLACGRSLTCGTHRCEEFCHTGHCAPCPRLSFTELTCECGEQVMFPPVRCGTRPPACSAPCRRVRECGHEPHHSCHQDACPPCVVLTTKRCHGGHEERKTIPCSQEEFSCGLPCGKPLPCGKHTCIKTCHKGPCDTTKCTQPCQEKRPSCGHPCAAPCHSGADTCPSAAPCKRLVRARCACARRSADRACCENARELAKMMSALAATKMQEGGSVDLSDVQRPGNMLKTLECDDECRVEARTRQLALALQIRNPDVSAKLAPRYSELVRATATKESAFASQIHDALTDLVQRAKKSKQKTRSHSFPSMNWQKRQFIHEMCEHFGCESVAYDAEPNRNVVATADKEKSWLPAMSVMEVLSREAGKRRVPGPVLRAVPSTAASKSKSGWATLTSTNAWAARSQPRPAPPTEAKIDYFDNPPEN